MTTRAATKREHWVSDTSTVESAGDRRQSWREPRAHETPALFRVRRQDIEFRDEVSGKVQIAVTVTNVGGLPSAPDHALIKAAPFGAFVPWRPLAVLALPGLEPGESTTLRTTAQRVIPQPLGDLSRIPPGRLLTAMGLGDDQPEETKESGRKGSRVATSLLDAFRRMRSPDRTDRSGLSNLPVSPFDLLTGPSTYWAGNLNVFVGGHDVERHQAKSLRILPGHTNIVMFCVGDRSADSYRFGLAGLSPTWEATLFDPLSPLSVARGMSEHKSIDLGSWVPIHRASIVFLALRAPANCRKAAVEVHVTQHSTQKTAVVEFSFDDQAPGPGCYVVS